MKGRKLLVPQDRVLPLLEKLDDVGRAAQSGPAYVAKHDLWEFIHTMFPETKEGNWHIDTTRANCDEMYLTEELPDPAPTLGAAKPESAK